MKDDEVNATLTKGSSQALASATDWCSIFWRPPFFWTGYTLSTTTAYATLHTRTHAHTHSCPPPPLSRPLPSKTLCPRLLGLLCLLCLLPSLPSSSFLPPAGSFHQLQHVCPSLFLPFPLLPLQLSSGPLPLPLPP